MFMKFKNKGGLNEYDYEKNRKERPLLWRIDDGYRDYEFEFLADREVLF